MQLSETAVAHLAAVERRRLIEDLSLSDKANGSTYRGWTTAWGPPRGLAHARDQTVRPALDIASANPSSKSSSPYSNSAASSCA